MDPLELELAQIAFELARRGATRQLSDYVDAGLPVNLANDRGDTLLMLAAYHGHEQTVAALLERGADPNRANDHGQTPLAGVIFKGEDAILERLLAAGADPRTGGPSALETARMFGRQELIDRFERGSTTPGDDR